MIKFSFSPESFQALEKIRRDLTEARTKLRNRRGLMEELKKEQGTRWKRNFTSQGSEYEGWKSLHPETIADRTRRGYSSGPILQRSGKLKSIVLSQTDAGKVSQVDVQWQFTNEGGASGDGGFPLTHHFGMYNDYWNVPSRPIWLFDDKDAERVERRGAKWVDTVLGGLFG